MSDLDELEEINLGMDKTGNAKRSRAQQKSPYLKSRTAGARDMAKWKRQLTAYRVNKERAK